MTFNRKNYNMWYKAVRTASTAKNKLGLIEGTLTKPKSKDDDDPTELKAWEMLNSMICSWMVNVINPKLHISMAYVETT